MKTSITCSAREQTKSPIKHNYLGFHGARLFICRLCAPCHCFRSSFRAALVFQMWLIRRLVLHINETGWSVFKSAADCAQWAESRSATTRGEALREGGAGYIPQLEPIANSNSHLYIPHSEQRDISVDVLIRDAMNRCTAALLLLVIAIYSLNVEGEPLWFHSVFIEFGGVFVHYNALEWFRQATFLPSDSLSNRSQSCAFTAHTADILYLPKRPHF